MRHDFTLTFGDFSVTRIDNATVRKPLVFGALHRLSSDQFDALADTFGVVGDEVRTLTTDSGRTFRTIEILFGDLKVALYSDE